MAILNLLKTGPALATMGTVGAGGTALTLWGTGVFGSGGAAQEQKGPEETSTSTPTVPQKPTPVDANKQKQEKQQKAREFLNFDEPRAKIDLEELIRNQESSTGDVITLSNDYYGKIPTSCLNSMFGNVSFHSSDKFKLDTQTHTQPKEGLTPKKPDSLTGAVDGCTNMTLSRNGLFFLMTSEAVIRRGNYGMALWTGVKTSKTPSNLGHFKINIRHFLAFFKSEDGNNWKTLGGYSWGEKDREFVKMVIKSPEGIINETFDVARSGELRATHQVFHGTWDPEKGKSLIFDINKYPYSPQHTVFNPHEARVLSASTHFLVPSDDYGTVDRPWKKYYCVKALEPWCKDNEISKTDAHPASQIWLKLFQEQKGSWVSA